jgi:hypothetical protein
MTMTGNFLPQQGFPRCAPLPQPVHTCMTIELR